MRSPIPGQCRLGTIVKDRGGRVDTVELSVPSLESMKDCLDLENALIGMNGVAGVTIDAVARTVSVEYDPAFGHAEAIRRGIVESGYPVTPDGST